MRDATIKRLVPVSSCFVGIIRWSDGRRSPVSQTVAEVSHRSLDWDTPGAHALPRRARRRASPMPISARYARASQMARACQQAAPVTAMAEPLRSASGALNWDGAPIRFHAMFAIQSARRFIAGKIVMGRAMGLLQRLATRRPLLTDSATGTWFQQRLGAEGAAGNCCDEYNVTAPDLVREMYRAKVRAGADVILTNTFNSSPLRLAEFDIPAEAADRFNAEAVHLLRQIVGEAERRSEERRVGEGG